MIRTECNDNNNIQIKTEDKFVITESPIKKYLLSKDDYLIGICAKKVEEVPIEANDVIIEETNKWGITLTDEEIDLLAKIVWLETRGESERGKRMVIEVVFNRMLHDEFKGNLMDVLSAKGQFCTWKSRNTANPTEDEYAAIDKVLKGESDELSLDHVYFSTSPRNNRGIIKEKNHYFCKY